MRFGLKDVNELPSMEEFEKLVAESFQSELITAEAPPAEATPADESEVTETEPASENVSETEKAG
jgi:segregation and condensation protein B